MRRTGFAILGVFVLQLLWPSSADAWWGWIDELTGPKGLHGFQMDARIKCFPNGGGKTDSEGELKAERPDPAKGPEATGGLSFCDETEDLNRLLSINVGWRLFWATDTSPELQGAPEAYADGHRMYLFTVTPTVQVRLCWMAECLNRSRDIQDLLDLVDVSAGGGYYRIASEGFSPLQGATIEYGATLHIPTSLSRTQRWTRFVPRFGITRIGFVDGFDANAFGPKLTGDKALAKHAGGIDWTWQKAIYIDILPRFE